MEARIRVTALVLVLMSMAAPAAAQTPQLPNALSLDQALAVAREQSEQVAAAEAGVKRARGQQYQARSQYLPQIYGTASYIRTLRSEFSALQEEGDTTSSQQTESCGSFAPNPALPIDQRVDSLESAVACQSNENPFAAFRDLPFGRAHQLSLGLSVSQYLFAGGRIQAQNRAANATRRSAEVALATAEAQTLLAVTQAYYDAVLSEHMVAIAEATLRQADTTLSQVRLARQVGDKPEFELLRAQVTRDTYQPIVIDRRADRDLAYTRLKQLLNLPLSQQLTLTTPLDDERIPVALTQASEAGALADTVTEARAPVRQAREGVRAQEALRRIATAQRLPTVTLSSQYGRVGYPLTLGVPAWSSLRENWTITAFLQVPLFTGGRIRGDELVAQGNLEEARAVLQQTREFAALDTRNTYERLAAAEANWRASTGTVQEATRAYQIADIRYREGISTQLELSDSRILLQQAQANRAVAARDLKIARARIALLKDLPLGITLTPQEFQAPSVTLPLPQPAQPQPQQTQTRANTGVQTSVVGNQ